jgi:NUMOD3 motif
VKQQIYGLVDPRDGRIRYIGVTKDTLSRRFSAHEGTARKGGEYPVSRWLRKLSRSDLRASIVLLEETEDRLRERYWIAYYRGQGGKLLNCTGGGEGLFEASPATRAKLSAANRGKQLSPEHKAKLAAAQLGRKYPPAVAEKRRPHLVGRATSLETKEKQRQAKVGKLLSPEHRANISASLAGKSKTPRAPASAETRAKLSAALTGRKHTEEAKAKMRKPKPPGMGAKLSATRLANKKKHVP